MNQAAHVSIPRDTLLLAVKWLEHIAAVNDPNRADLLEELRKPLFGPHESSGPDRSSVLEEAALKADEYAGRCRAKDWEAGAGAGEDIARYIRALKNAAQRGEVTNAPVGTDGTSPSLPSPQPEAGAGSSKEKP